VCFLRRVAWTTRTSRLQHRSLSPNNSSKPNLFRYRKSVAGKAPREHDVPLIAEGVEAMNQMGKWPYLLTLTQGTTPAGIFGMGNALDAVNEAMSKAEELPGGRFTARDLRRTVETRLSAEGVSIEDRSHLQSHGLSGVQTRHYDRYKRINEARAALEKLRRLLDPPGDVLAFRKPRSKNA